MKLPSQTRHQVSMTLTTATPIYVMPLHYTEQMPTNYAQQIAGLCPTSTINYAKMSLHNVSPDITLEFCQHTVSLNVACATLNVTVFTCYVLLMNMAYCFYYQSLTVMFLSVPKGLSHTFDVYTVTATKYNTQSSSV